MCYELVSPMCSSFAILQIWLMHDWIDSAADFFMNPSKKQKIRKTKTKTDEKSFLHFHANLKNRQLQEKS